eukprot:82112_1
MSIILWLEFIVIFLCPIQSKFVDNGLHTHLKQNEFRQINLENNAAIGDHFETSQFHLKYKTQQKYKNIPIFGATLVVEEDQDKTIPISGRWYDINDIDQLVSTTDPQFNEYQAFQIALDGLNINSNNVYSNSPSKLNIYYHHSFPYLSWIVKFSYINPQKQDEVHHPIIVINALTGNILQIFDQSYNVIEACGDGGNGATGIYKYCVDKPSLFINDNTNPVLENDIIQIYENHGNSYYDHSQATKVTCSGSTHPLYVDDGYTNGAFCPACDLFSFANVVFEMFDEWSNATYPISDAFIPMKLYVHVGSSWANANFEPDTGEMNFGDGNSAKYPFVVLDITSHEIAHGYTDQGSDLIYSGESGGMNEAFSDIAGEAAEYWFFGSNDWLVGNHLSKNNGALRYMNNPPQDGISIDHYSNYYGQNVHYTSGLYNKAAYNLNTNGNWTMEQIFRVFAWANLYYWTTDSTFNEGVT